MPGSELSPASFSSLQKIGEGAAEGLRALPDFERRKGVDMDAGHRLLDRAAHAEIGGAGVFGVDAALQAHFGGAALPGFLDPAPDLGQIEVIGPAAQILAELAFGESAELAAEIADVGVVDVAGHDIADGVAVDPPAQPVGGLADLGKGVAARLEQPHDLGFGQGLARRRAVENGGKLPLIPLPACAQGTLSRAAGEGPEPGPGGEGG